MIHYFWRFVKVAGDLKLSVPTPYCAFSTKSGVEPIFSSPKSTKNQNRKRDPEMKSTKKGQNYHFGTKLHIGVCARTGYLHTHTTTAANAHDITEAHNLIRNDDDFVSGDSGYSRSALDTEK
jgi:IS5 family transposase